MRKKIVEQRDFYDDNYNIGCWKLTYQVKSFEIKDFEYWKNKIKNKEIKPYNLYKDKIQEKNVASYEVLLRGTWKQVKNNIIKEITKCNCDTSYIWFSYMDMYEPVFTRVIRSKIFYMGQFFDTQEKEQVENKIYSKLIAQWEASIK